MNKPMTDADPATNQTGAASQSDNEIDIGNDAINAQPSQNKVSVKTDIWDEDFDINSSPKPDGVQQQPPGSDEKPKGDDSGQSPTPDTSLNWENKYKEQLLVEESKKLPSPILLKHKGKVLEIDNARDLRDLAEKGLGATAKFQEMSEQRRFLEKIESAGITQDDVELLRRARMGDSEAANALISAQPGPEPVDTDTLRSIEQADAIANEIISKPYADDFKTALSLIPDESRESYAYNPKFMSALKADFDQGIAQKILPVAQKLVAVKGMDFIDAYKQAGLEVLKVSGNNNRNTGNQDKQDMANRLANAPGSKSSITKEEPKDVWSMSSDEFQRIMGKVRN